MSKEIYKPLDYVPDRHDPEDWLMRKKDVIRKLGKDAWIQMKRDTPKPLSHRDNMSSVKDQMSHGSCTGFAVAAVAEWFAIQEWLKLKKQKGENLSIGSNPFSDLSERWIYEHARDFDPFPEDTEGSTIRAALKVMQKLGIPVESAWPYYDKHDGGPEEGAEKSADLITIDNYYKVKTGSIKDHIWALFHSPIPIAIEVFPELYEPDADGKVTTPDRNSERTGLHAVCCLPGTTIRTEKGLECIEDIKPGDQVLTREGYKPVINNFSREINEEVYNIQSSLSFEPLKVTKEHPVMAKKCSKETKYKYLRMHLADFYKSEDLKEGYFIQSKIDDTVIDKEHLSPDFCRLLGHYTGDGNLNFRYSNNGNVKSGVLRFTYHNKNDIEYIEDIINTVRQYNSKITYGIYSYDHHNIITFSNTELAKEVWKYCGGAKNKSISQDLLYLPIDKQMEFIRGWFHSDGCGYWLSNRCMISTSCKNLAESLILLLQRCRLIYHITTVPAGTCTIRRKTHNQQCNYQIGFHDIYHKSRLRYKGDNLFSRIRSISTENYKGPVYNLEVKDKPEYIADNVLVHNCCTGYHKDDEDLWFEIKNSWGSDYGDNGYCYINRKYLHRHEVAAWSFNSISSFNPDDIRKSLDHIQSGS